MSESTSFVTVSGSATITSVPGEGYGRKVLQYAVTPSEPEDLAKKILD